MKQNKEQKADIERLKAQLSQSFTVEEIGKAYEEWEFNDSVDIPFTEYLTHLKSKKQTTDLPVLHSKEDIEKAFVDAVNNSREYNSQSASFNINLKSLLDNLINSLPNLKSKKEGRV